MSKTFTIGMMAKVGNCKVQTIRYYEKIGLLPEPTRTEGNQRIYFQQDLDRLKFIRHSRELGFPLEHIQQILLIYNSPDHSCQEVDKIAQTHLRDVESKIKRLQEMQKELKRMISQCSGDRIADCRIIEVLSNHQLCLNNEHDAIGKDSDKK